MAYFAKVLDGLVVDVHTVATAVITDPDGQQVEALGQAFLSDLWGGEPAAYIRTHYPVDQPTPYPRGCFAGFGYTYDPVADIFAAPVGAGAEGVDLLVGVTPPPVQGFDESGYTHDT